MSENNLPASPYKGLTSYAEADAPFFFGRERERNVIAANLRSSRLTVIYGESGVGKSSLLRAGVVADLLKLATETLNRRGQPRLAVVFLNEWHHNPVPEMKELIGRAVEQGFGDLPVETLPTPTSLFDACQQAAESVGGKLLVILDQFEDYFLHRNHWEAPDNFVNEFLSFVNNPALPVNFLISIRADAHDKLEEFKPRIPFIFSNSLRVDALSREAAHDAITKPIEQYNKLSAPDDLPIKIEAGLAEEILDQLETTDDAKTDGARTSAESKRPIKTQFLQLVMAHLWKAERAAGSIMLKRKTLQNLGDFQGIVRKHLDDALASLDSSQRQLALRAFRHLVLPSGIKVALPVTDLADYLKADQVKLAVLLEKLTASGQRILSTVGSQTKNNSTLYEIAHDVLARPILDYVQIERAAERVREEARHREFRRTRIAAVVFALLFVIVACLAWWVKQQRDQIEKLRKQTEDSKNLAEETNNQVLPALYELLYEKNNFNATEKRFNEALDFCKQKGSLICEGVTLSKLGELFYRGGGYQQARRYYEEALPILEQNLSPNHPYVADSLNGLADILVKLGNFDEAEQLYKRALEMLETASGNEAADKGDSLRGVGKIYQQRSQFAEAEQMFQQARAWHERLLSANHQETATDLSYLADLYYQQKKFAEAGKLYEAARATLEKTLGPNSPLLASALNNLGAIYASEAKYTQAEPLFKQALEINRRAIEPNALAVTDNLINLGNLYVEFGDLYKEEAWYLKAWNHYDEALTELEKLPLSSDLVLAIDRLAFTEIKLSRFKEAENLLRQARQFQQQIQPKPSDKAQLLNTQAELYRAQGSNDGEAERLYKDALEIREKEPGAESLEITYTLNGLALLYFRQGRYVKAEPLFKRALDIRKKLFAESQEWHPHIAEVLENNAETLRRLNRTDEIVKVEKQAEDIKARCARENPNPPHP